MATRPWPPTNVVRVAIEGTTAKGVNWANIFWTGPSATGTPTSTQMTAVATAFYGAYNTHLFALLGKDAHMTRAVANWYGNSPMQVVGDYLDSTAGGSSDNTEVDSLAACISWTIPVTWRGGKPRTYLPALPTNAFQDSNTLGSSFLSSLETGAAAYNSAINALSGLTPFSDWVLGMVSFFSGNAPRSPAEFYAFSSSTVHPRIDSQRRRLGKEVT